MAGKQDKKEKVLESRRLWEGEEKVGDTALTPEV